MKILNSSFISLFFIPWLFIACKRGESAAEKAKGLMARGNFDRALSVLNQARKSSDRQELRILSGKILSTRRISVFAGLELLTERAKKPPMGLTEDLFYLYLDMNRPDRAAELLAPEVIGIEKYFLPETEMLRTAVGCIASRRSEMLQRLADQEDLPARDHLRIRCLLSRGQNEEVQALLPELLNGNLNLWKCRSLALLRVETDFLSRIPDETWNLCLLRFPGDLVLRRERPILKEGASLEKARYLFDTDFEIPPYSEHTWYPYWKNAL